MVQEQNFSKNQETGSAHSNLLINNLTISSHTPLLRNKEGRSVVAERVDLKTSLLEIWVKPPVQELARFGDLREYARTKRAWQPLSCLSTLSG